MPNDFFFTSFKFKVIHEAIHILPPPCEGMRWGYINDGVYINNESLYELVIRHAISDVALVKD